MPFSRRSLVAALALGACLSAIPLAAVPAEAQPAKQACFDAYPNAQRLRKAGKLRASRAELVTCSQDACPAAMRKDCTQWMSEVAADIPSIVIAATDESGADTPEVAVVVDGERAKERLDGNPLELDPGEHTLTLTHRGATLERAIVLRAGERRRTIAVSFAKPKTATPAPSATAAPTTAPPDERPKAGVPTATYVLGGVGLASLAASAYFYFDQKRVHDDLSSSCAPRCSPDDVSPLKTRQLLAGITGGVGVVALGAAIALYVTRPSAETNASVGLLRGSPGLGLAPGAATLSYSGRFQ